MHKMQTQKKERKHRVQIWQPALGYVLRRGFYSLIPPFSRSDRVLAQAPHRRRVFPRRAHSWKNVDVELPIVSAQSRTRFRRTEGGKEKKTFAFGVVFSQTQGLVGKLELECEVLHGYVSVRLGKGLKSPH